MYRWLRLLTLSGLLCLSSLTVCNAGLQPATEATVPSTSTGPPLSLGTTAFFFVLFLLWPFENQPHSQPDDDWRLLVPSHRKKSN